ncbi:hypothetical protein F5Y14DRAFT_428731, partial [Nemania sp. NC0429]
MTKARSGLTHTFNTRLLCLIFLFLPLPSFQVYFFFLMCLTKLVRMHMHAYKVEHSREIHVLCVSKTSSGARRMELYTQYHLPTLLHFTSIPFVSWLAWV